MKKYFFILGLLSFCVVKIVAQKGIDALIQAEKNFAAYSVSNSTKEAFLKFLDSAGIVFENAKPVNGIETWNKREKRPGVLNWRPQYAEIAISGDFGYTTGPWTFQNSLADSVVVRGQYTTVWHITKSDEWKFLVDLGVGNTPTNSPSEVKKIDAPKQTTKIITQVSQLVIAENNFQASYAKNKSKAYEKFLSTQSIVNRNGHLPAKNSADKKLLIDATPSSIKYEMKGLGASEGEDIGYTYGTTFINGKTENYLRIWRREKNGWKIALEVLRY